jgi:hypothetical protein
VSYTRYRIDAGSWYTAPASPFTLGNFTNGTHQVSLYCVDAVGNVGSTVTFTVKMDVVNPSISIAYSAIYTHASKNWVSGSTLFSLSSSDAGSGVLDTSYQVNAGPSTTYSGPFQLGTFANGTYVIQYQVIDRVGNTVTRSETVFIDAIVPSTSMSYTPACAGWVNATTVFTLTASDGQSGITATWHSIDSGPWVATMTFTIATGGNHVINWYSIDHCGNVEPSRSIIISVDATPPVTTIVPHSGLVNASTTFTLAASDTSSGVLATFYLWNGTWLDYTSPFSINETMNETVVISFYSIDRAGNAGNISNISVQFYKPFMHPVQTPNPILPEIYLIITAICIMLIAGLAIALRQVNARRRAPDLRVSIPATYKAPVVIAGFTILLAIPLAMLLALHMTYPAWYWARTGNVFTDWGIWVLDILPAWICISVAWLGSRAVKWMAFKLYIFYLLAGWLLYDWVWWFIVGVATPASFSWTAPFYFDILMKDPPMWLFLCVAVLGLVVAVVEWQRTRGKDHSKITPFILYLIFMYGLGGVTQITPVPAWFYAAWDFTWVIIIGMAIVAGRRH